MVALFVASRYLQSSVDTLCRLVVGRTVVRRRQCAPSVTRTMYSITPRYALSAAREKREEGRHGIGYYIWRCRRMHRAVATVKIYEAWISLACL